MLTLIAAAALAAQPAAPAPASPKMQHDMHMQIGQSDEHNGMDCCKDCCKDKADKHAGHGSEHADHSSR